MSHKQIKVKEVVKNIGLLNDTQIQSALEEQLRTRERFASILVKKGYIANQDVGKTLIPQIGILPIALKTQDLDEKFKDLIIPEIALSHRLILIRQDHTGAFIIGTDDPLNFLAEQNLEKILALSIEIVLVHSIDLDRLLKERYGLYEKVMQDIKTKPGSPDRAVDTKDQDAPIIKLVNLLIAEAVRRRASDIHIEPLGTRLRVRYRIDGVLHEVPGPSKKLQGSIISRIKIMAGMNIAEKRLPQDGRIKIELEKKELDLRVSSLPAMYGESIVMRILDKTGFLVGLEDIGFLPDHRKDFERLINLPNGMILVTGPTGSGKTTTLYATLSHINQKERKVITIEDPVEYQLDGINQVQVKPQIGLTFANGLRSILRQAPDIIMVGEIRDFETAEIAIQSALTGHLIFSTLHTNDAPSAITRLVDMGVKAYLVASTVQGVLAQRLVRTICPSCRYSYKPSSEEKMELMLKAEDADSIELYKGKGCPDCNGTGFKGRMGIFELLILNDEIREMILYNASATEIQQRAKKLTGFRTLKEDGLEKVKRGYTTIEEVARVTQDV